MNPNLPLSNSHLDEIFVLGFDGSFGECLINYTRISDDFKVREFENSFLVFQQLENILKENGTGELPSAIVCEYGSLEQENFLLLHNVRKHPVLKFIPFIAMNRDGLNHKLAALRLGFDDYYDVPVHSGILKERIHFLASFKKQIDTCEIEEMETFKVPVHPLKRAFDILFASLAILLLSPLFLLIGLLIMLESPGGVIYRSKRVGTGYHVFDFLKFRSMYKDADKRLADLREKNQYGNGEEALFMKFSNDPRVTRIGRFIRKTSIDELPQLFNILKGDMSIVGNRPLPLYEAEQLTRDSWARRFLAPAGLTGLWQVTKRGKNDMDPEERIGLDITYAEKYSFWFDFKIILKTPFALIQEENV
ncbi:MAG TPA: sugar transferase [Bacteroidetes bacterium]|nr:sugar transferase [Bacteroidota bacterium]